VLDKRAGGGVEAGPGGERDRAAADPHREEVGVGGATLPEAVGLVDDGPERRRAWVEVLGDGELGGGQLVGLGRDLLEVGQVAGPVSGLARRAARRSTRRSPSPAATEAAAAPAIRATSHTGRGPGTVNRNAIDPPVPSSGTRYCSRPAADEADEPTTGGAATVSSITGTGGGCARTGRCTRNPAVPGRPGTPGCPGSASAVAEFAAVAMNGTLRRRHGRWTVHGEVVDNCRPADRAGAPRAA
jgi:hypothetical protein